MALSGKIKIVVILGPTASGKSRLALELAPLFDAEIVSADSMQVYRFMDIGTAKPSMEDRKRVPHHLIDVVNPDEDYTAARFRKDGAKAIEGIHARNKNILVVGGTGLYIRALTEGIFEGPEADMELRRRLIEEAAVKGKRYVHEMLGRVDPVSASRIHPNNLIRTIRALEVYYLSRRPMSEFHREHRFSERPYDVLKIGLNREREVLYRDIDRRVDRMMEAGLVDEVKRLLEMGYSRDLKPLQGLGYKEMLAYIDGRLTLDEALGLVRRNTRHYARRQMTWFRRDGSICWFRPDERRGIIEAIKDFLDREAPFRGSDVLQDGPSGGRRIEQ